MTDDEIKRLSLEFELIDYPDLQARDIALIRRAFEIEDEAMLRQLRELANQNPIKKP